VLDTSVVIDPPAIDEALLPLCATVTAVTLAGSSQGPHLAATPKGRSVRLALPLVTRHAADFGGLQEALDVVAVR
jgi:hypothetical protein